MEEQSSKPAPQLPHGDTSTFQGLSENFAFHASPESFIAQRILQFQKLHPDVVNCRAVVRAKILNRNVAIVSSYSHILQILREQDGAEPDFVANAAYDKLMGPFFPAPNLLLTDGGNHTPLRESWDSRMAQLVPDCTSFVKDVAKSHFESLASSGTVDLYTCMKTLSWKILLGTFLGLEPSDEDFGNIESLQENLLRGQFSLLPVSIDTGFWKSPRRVGIDAMSKLQTVITKRLRTNSCPFAASEETDWKDIADHILLFTSSLAAKALASLLTALFLNVYLLPRESGETGCLALLFGGEAINSDALSNLIMETERLSPPIVGILRRATRDYVLSSKAQSPDTLLPQGWEAWIYFVGGGRDPEAFGQDANLFKPERYADSNTPAPFTFGAGPKGCLGRTFVREALHQTAKSCLESGIRMTSDRTGADGVRAWLGWDGVCSPDKWAADMKQLPTQHPRLPIMVNFLSP